MSSRLLLKRFPVSVISAKKIKISCFSRPVWNCLSFDSLIGKERPFNHRLLEPKITKKLIRLGFRIRPGDEKFVFDNGVVLHSSQCKPSFGPWHSAIIDFAHSLQSMDIDLSAFACLVALTLVTGKSRQELARWLIKR